jgi:DNA-binding LytR/AlgR family response regulator
MKVVIIEDEPHAAERLVSLIKSLQPDWQITGMFDSIKKSVAWLGVNSCDLIFMDIQLADGLSFEIFEKTTVESPVIFTTAYNDYALKAFKVNSIDYLLKPIDKEELKAAVKKYETLTQRTVASDTMMQSISNVMQMLTKKYKERFVVKVGEHLRTIEVGDILFLYSMEKATFAQTADGRRHVLDFTLDQLEELLPPERFFRINRKYIVAVNAIQDMINHTNSRLKLILKNCEDQDVIVARERVQEFRDWLDR